MLQTLGCHDTETVQTITHSPSTWQDHIVAVRRKKSAMKGTITIGALHRYHGNTLVTGTDTVVCHQCNTLASCSTSSVDYKCCYTTSRFSHE